MEKSKKLTEQDYYDRLVGDRNIPKEDEQLVRDLASIYYQTYNTPAKPYDFIPLPPEAKEYVDKLFAEKVK